MVYVLEFIYRHHGASLEQIEKHFNDGGVLLALAELVKNEYLSGFNLEAKWSEDDVINWEPDFSKLPFSVPRTTWFQTLPKGDAAVEDVLERKKQRRFSNWLAVLALIISVIALLKP